MVSYAVKLRHLLTDKQAKDPIWHQNLSFANNSLLPDQSSDCQPLHRIFLDQ
jgi:hypothetical protein